MRPGSASDTARAFAEARSAMAGAWRAAALDATALAPDPGLSRLLGDALGAPDATGWLRSVWLLLVAVTGAFPGVEELEDAALALRTGGAAEVVADVVRSAVEPQRSRDSRCLGGTLVDVTMTARAAAHAGVPRVVRELVRSWGEPADLHYVVWDNHGLRTANEEERALLGLPAGTTVEPGSWVVPWDARYVAAEILRPERHATAVEAMALAGVVDLGAVVYDLAAIVEPDPDATRGPFLHYLSALARGSRISAISEAIADDVRDYLSLLARNGRPQPEVRAHALPDSTVWAPADPELREQVEASLRGERSWPVVAAVSSVYRRKNHARLLSACEQLWDEGQQFRLLLVAGMGSRVPAVDHAVDRLVERGRPVTVLSGLDERALHAAYEIAHVTAYVSLAEGYGLPIAESLSARTPVVASGHGSMAELAAAGGVLLVDPRDEQTIAAGLRTALVDRSSFAQLAADAAQRPAARTWEQYAAAVGGFLGIPGAHATDTDSAGRAS